MQGTPTLQDISTSNKEYSRLHTLQSVFFFHVAALGIQATPLARWCWRQRPSHQQQRPAACRRQWRQHRRQHQWRKRGPPQLWRLAHGCSLGGGTNGRECNTIELGVGGCDAGLASLTCATTRSSSPNRQHGIRSTPRTDGCAQTTVCATPPPGVCYTARGCAVHFFCAQ